MTLKSRGLSSVKLEGGEVLNLWLVVAQRAGSSMFSAIELTKTHGASDRELVHCNGRYRNRSNQFEATLSESSKLRTLIGASVFMDLARI